MSAAILGISYYLPDRVETNEDLARENPDWRLDELAEKSGILARHIAAPGETASDLGYHAAMRLMERGIVAPAEIDYLLYCTQSPDYFLPTSACVLQDRLGLGMHVGALDSISAARDSWSACKWPGAWSMPGWPATFCSSRRRPTPSLFIPEIGWSASFSAMRPPRR